MARLTKIDIVTQLHKSVKSDPTIRDPEVYAAALNVVVKGRLQGRGAFGERVHVQPIDQSNPLTLINPLSVNPSPVHNPYLSYLFDKIGEAMAISHQGWQSQQQVWIRIPIYRLDKLLELLTTGTFGEFNVLPFALSGAASDQAFWGHQIPIDLGSQPIETVTEMATEPEFTDIPQEES